MDIRTWLLLSRPDWSYAGYTVDKDTSNRYCSVLRRCRVDKLWIELDDQLVNHIFFKSADKAQIYDGHWLDNSVIETKIHLSFRPWIKPVFSADIKTW